MKRFPVKSSNLAEVGWEFGDLEVRFRSGVVYRYSGVPLWVFAAVRLGVIDGSVGRTFHRLVRQGEYPYVRVITK